MYAYKIEPDTAGFLVTFRDIPEALSAGGTIEEARANAGEALITALEFYFEDRRPVPAPSRAKVGEEVFKLPVVLAAKVELHNAVLSQGIRRAALARNINAHASDVDRLLDVRHPSKIGAIETAMQSLGKYLVVGVVDADAPKTLVVAKSKAAVKARAQSSARKK